MAVRGEVNLVMNGLKICYKTGPHQAVAVRGEVNLVMNGLKICYKTGPHQAVVVRGEGKSAMLLAPPRTDECCNRRNSEIASPQELGITAESWDN